MGEIDAELEGGGFGKGVDLEPSGCQRKLKMYTNELVSIESCRCNKLLINGRRIKSVYTTVHVISRNLLDCYTSVRSRA